MIYFLILVSVLIDVGSNIFQVRGPTFPGVQVLVPIETYKHVISRGSPLPSPSRSPNRSMASLGEWVFFFFFFIIDLAAQIK